MSKEYINFEAINLVEQPPSTNAGNVTEEIGRVGAEAYKKYLNQNYKMKPAETHTDRKVPVIDTKVHKGAANAADYAMEQAVRASAEAFAVELLVSPEAVKAFSDSIVAAFINEQIKNTAARVKIEIEIAEAKIGY